MTFFVLSVFPAPDSPLRPRSTSNQRGCIYNARNQDTLILSLIAHIDPSTFCNCKNMWWVVVSPFITILLDYRIRVEGKILIGVNGDKE